MTILITGGSGALGSELKKVFPTALAPTHQELDLTNAEQVKAYFEKHPVDLIIHAAALTGIRQCEDDRMKAFKTNVLGTALLNNFAKKMIYVSTACVFSGDDDTKSYTEDDLPNPKNYYALSKYLGEFQVLKVPYNRIVMRTNFIGLKPYPYDKAFVDRKGTYLFANHVAKAIGEIANKMLAVPENQPISNDIIHICGNKTLSMYELAQKLHQKLGIVKNISPTTLADYTGPPLTKNMCLATTRWVTYDIDRT